MYKWMHVSYAVTMLFRGYCLQYFYGSFLESRTKGRRNGMYVAALYAALRLAFYWLLPSSVTDYRVAVAALVMNFCILAVPAYCFYRAFRPIAIFLIVAFEAISGISSYVSVILFDKIGSSLLDVWNWCAGKGWLTSEKAFAIVVKGGVIGTWLLQHATIALILYISLKKIVRDFREKDYEIHRTERAFLLTPALVGLMLCVLLRIIMVTVENHAQEMLYDKYPVLLVLLPAILLLSLLAILYGVKLFQHMIDVNRERGSRMVLEQQVSSMQGHMKEMERMYSGISRMKHDMKNTIMVIQQLSGGHGEDNRELQAYLSGLNQTFESLEMRFKTGNTVVDTLLNMKYHEAVSDVPDLEMDAEQLFFPQDLRIHSYDIGVILGNALDNAIEACRKLKIKEPEADAFIRLSSLQKGNILIFKAENSFNGTLVRKYSEELPKTDKADKKSHGIGLANIKSTAEKYEGTMDFKVKGKVFVLSVMMKNKPETY